MNLGKKLVSLAAGVALVAGAGLVATAPASAAGKVSGTTVATFDKQFAPLIAALTVIPPAKAQGTKLSFPVTGRTGTTVTHSGGIEVGGFPATNPSITLTAATKTSTITFLVGGNPLELFTSDNIKVTTNKKAKTTTWKGVLRLTSNQDVVDLLKGLLAIDTLTPGMKLGSITTTVKSK